MGIDAINSMISWLGGGLQNVLQALPQSPFNTVYSIDNSWIGSMNYILPFSQAVAHLEAYIAAVILYYGIRIVLKWLKAAGN